MIWEQPELDAAERARALIAAVRGRKDLKRLGRWLEDAGDAPLREALIAAALAAGVALPEDALHWPGKRLLRRALGREPDARERTTPIANDEAFTCMSCGAAVPPAGSTSRDHCPFCLRSRHVDVVPGDRAAACGGRMDPTTVTVTDRRVTLHYRCTRCGVEKVNRAVTEGEVPDDWEVLVRLSAGTLG